MPHNAILETFKKANAPVTPLVKETLSSKEAALRSLHLSGSSGRETDYYGPRTMRAVAQWQSLMGVAPTHGFFGPRSRAAYRALAPKAVQAQTPPSPPVSIPNVAVSPSPSIASVVPDRIADGDTIVINGSGFATDEENLMRYSIDPPGFTGRGVGAEGAGRMSMLIDIGIREKLRDQIASVPEAVLSFIGTRSATATRS